MAKKAKRLLALLGAAAILAVSVPVSAYAEETDGSGMYADTMSVLDALVTDEVSSSNAWVIMTTARAGVLTQEQATAWYGNLEKTLQEQESAALPTDSSYTPNIVTVLAVTAIGKDATDVGGYNLLEPLADMSYCSGYVTTAANALLALDSKNYSVPAAPEGAVQTTREALIQSILDARNSTGTWGYSYEGVDYSDVDTIAMAIQALAPYYSSDDNVRRAVDDGLTVLAVAQDTDGSVNYCNACSTAQVIVALTALGRDPATDAQFTNSGKTLIDGLGVNYVPGSGFKGYDRNVDLAFSTLQAGYALVACDRIANGKKSLYDMTDAVELVVSVAEVTDTEAAAPSTEAAATAVALDQSPKTGDPVPVAAVSLLFLSAAATMAISRRKQI